MPPRHPPPAKPPAPPEAARAAAPPACRRRSARASASSGASALLSRLLEARRLRCIVVTGPAGAGKSTLVAAWRQALVPLGFDIAWFTPGAHDDAPARFLAGPAGQRGAGRARRRCPTAATPPIDTTTPTPSSGWSISLVRGIAAHPRDLALVLDDLHHLRHPAILDALQWLLDYAPPKLHLVLASRGGLRLSLDRLRSQSQTLELDQRDLRFTPAESAQYLKAQLGDAVDARTARSLHELSDGWVAGLRLFTLDWKKKQQEAGRADAGPALRRPAGPRCRRADAVFRAGGVSRACRRTNSRSWCTPRACKRICAPLCAALVGAPERGGRGRHPAAAAGERRPVRAARSRTSRPRPGTACIRCCARRC